MEIHPRYDGPPLIELDGEPAAVAAPAVRQRRRLLEVLATFSEDDWAHPSRCAGWSNRDVMVHLDSTNAFWAFSIRAGLDGRPTRFLDGFDPARSPADLVAADGATSGAEVLERLTASSDALVAVWEGLDADDWTRLAEAPPGHLRVTEVTHHALWDSWVHERDVLVPLGREQVIEADEVLSSLRYGAALGPAVVAVAGDEPGTRPAGGGVLGVDPEGLDAPFAVHLGPTVRVVGGTAGADVVLRGDAVDLVDALCFRTPLGQELAPEHLALLGGLAAVFDLAD